MKKVLSLVLALLMTASSASAVLADDVVAIADSSKDSVKIKAVLESNGARPVPQWLDKTSDTEAKIVALPERDQIACPVEEQLIVELYSK